MPTRRLVLAALGAVGGLAATRATVVRAAPASDPTPLDVAYAGSMTSLVEGPLKAAALAEIGVDLRGRPQGASALAALIAGGTISPDAFISVTASPMQNVIKAGKATGATAVARTRMVIAYSPKGAIGAKLADAGKPGATPWYEVLAQPGVRFGRTDPKTDPQGRNIIFTMQLAQTYYKRPGLVAAILGPTQNPQQIFVESNVESRLQGGELDAASAYAVQPGAFGLPSISLPPEIDLGDAADAQAYVAASLVLDGKTYRPEPLVYYVAPLTGSAHPDVAKRFATWLVGPSAQALFARAGYDAPGTSPALS